MTFPLHMLFFFTLALGTIVAVNASSWVVAWIGLEVNLLSFLPIMAEEKTKGSSESCVKYFLIQSMASLMILIASVFSLSSVMDNSVIIFVGLSIKLGVAPFHFWFPVVMEGLNWGSCLVLMTWQSLAPFFLTSFVEILVVLVLLSAFVGAVGGFGQTSLKSMLAFSSISHVGWMMAGMMWGVKVGFMYYLIYFFLSVLVVVMFFMFKIFHLSQINSFSYFTKVMIMLGFLSLGGLPPMLGFFPKWMVIEKLLWGSLVVAFVLIVSSLVSLYFYLRTFYPFLLLKTFSAEAELGGTSYVILIVAFIFLSSGGVFVYPLLSVI